MLLLFTLSALDSCGNVSYGTRAGVDVTWGPNGPKLRPHINLNVYNGGRL